MGVRMAKFKNRTGWCVKLLYQGCPLAFAALSDKEKHCKAWHHTHGY